jgi:hypothetical protein
MLIRNHLGSTFEIWTGRHTWFWFIADGYGNGAAIGAAANEAEAIGEARLSIEEMAARGSFAAESPGRRKPTACPTSKRRRAGSSDPGWNLLANRECYFARLCIV